MQGAGELSSEGAARAAAIHERAIFIDGQGVAVIVPTALIEAGPVDGRDYIARVLAAGVTAQNLTLGVGGLAQGADDFRSSILAIHGYLCLLEVAGARLLLVETGDDIGRAKAEGKLGLIFGFQGVSGKIEQDPNLLRVFHRLGVRVVQLTYNERDPIGCGCLEPVDTGLTQYGRVVVRELNHLGILVDLSHAGERTSLDVMTVSRAPVAITHANVRALCDNPRNVTDEQLRALTQNGGVLGITVYSPFCETRPGVRPTVEDYVTHVDYVAQHFGIDHVGIGSDIFEAESPLRYECFFRVRYPEVVRGYGMAERHARGLEEMACLPRITEALVNRGYPEEDIHKVLGGNFLRVFRAAWRSR